MEQLLGSERLSNNSILSLKEQFIEKLKQLEGQCKIKKTEYLKVSYPKAIVLTTLLTVSVVGLFLLKYFHKLRAKVFYSAVSAAQIPQATHVYVIGQEGEQEICPITRSFYDQSERAVFEFKKLKYEIYGDRSFPLGFPYTEKLDELRREPLIGQGLHSSQISSREAFYGKNEHRVEVPSYLEFLFDTMTQPFFLFQYFVSLIYVLENVALFGILMIVFGFVTTTVNYFLLRKSYNKIKETAEKLFKVKVLRDGKLEEIDNIDIVPGDLFEPNGEIPCDALLIKGELFVDEVNLTGENVPIAKTKLVDSARHNDKSHWLYEGSKVETIKQISIAVAIHVGYSSQRGRIIRKILNKTMRQPQFFTKLIWFQLQVMVISVIIYLLSLPQILSIEVDTILVVFRFFDFITFSFPAPFPIFFNLAYSFCLVRLSKETILGTQAQKTVEASRLQTLCFDKTGTLTLNHMKINGVLALSSSAAQSVKDVTNELKTHPLLAPLFATCNSVELIAGEPKGDEIDLRMFEFAEAAILPAQEAGVVREVATGDRVVEVLRINQYESQFQSMSVLVRSRGEQRYFVFAKGSPELIHQASVSKVPEFDQLVKRLSFAGLRSIGCGFREVSRAQADNLLLCGREEYLRNIEILGLATFVNPLKEDACSTLATLAECGINTKIITGDNIFLGVQTAFSAGILPAQCCVTVVEGQKYSAASNSLHALHLTRGQDGSIAEREEFMADFAFESVPGRFYAVDNDFIRARPEDFLHESVKVFARTSPENKALIVRKYKERILAEETGLTRMQRLLRDCRRKVGMVGDGANDLIAIKEADVGIGLSSSDAVFSASFGIKQLQQILQIIKQSKNTERQIVQMAKYYGITQFISITVTLILSTDTSFFTALQMIYKNFLNTLILTLFFGMTKPALKMTKYLNNSNLIDLQNHLVFWATTVIYSLGLIVSYVYYFNSSDFVPNPKPQARFPDGWYGETKSSTVNFITANILYILLPLAIYRSDPWKLPIWTNKPMMVTIIANLALLIPISFFTQTFGFMGLQHIEISDIIIVWAMMLITTLIVIIVNKIIERVSFNKMKMGDAEKLDAEGNELLSSRQL